MGVGPDSPSPWAMQLGSHLCWRRRRGLSVHWGNETVPTDEHGRGAGGAAKLPFRALPPSGHGLSAGHSWVGGEGWLLEDHFMFILQQIETLQ